MAFYSKKQNQLWVWIAYNRKQKRPIGFHCGSRCAQTGKILFKMIKPLSASIYATDCWRAYQEFIPPKQHVRGKRHTQRIEGFNSIVRRWLVLLERLNATLNP